MEKKDGKDYIYVVWKEPRTRRQYTIGELVKNGCYQFSYGYEVERAIEEGFKGFICFDDFKKTYYSDVLFPAFSSRLPDQRRKGIDRILKRYGLNEYNAYELLKRSGAKLPTDNYEFIDPLPLEIKDCDIERYFYIAGPRHYIGCKGNECNNSIDINAEDKLNLVLESKNKFDNYAIKVYDNKENHIGYIPRYYSERLTYFIKNNYDYYCYVHIVNKEGNCNECIKAKLIIKAK